MLRQEGNKKMGIGDNLPKNGGKILAAGHGTEKGLVKRKIMALFNHKMHSLSQILGIFNMYTRLIAQRICILPSNFSLQCTRHINQ